MLAMCQRPMSRALTAPAAGSPPRRGPKATLCDSRTLHRSTTRPPGAAKGRPDGRRETLRPSGLERTGPAIDPYTVARGVDSTTNRQRPSHDNEPLRKGLLGAIYAVGPSDIHTEVRWVGGPIVTSCRLRCFRWVGGFTGRAHRMFGVAATRSRGCCCGWWARASKVLRAVEEGVARAAAPSGRWPHGPEQRMWARRLLVGPI